ncbi:MAG: AI-2E family transporter [Paenibacillus sp. RIFOXYA1_FULL_44_5]|nr:MAG: AI-2E family transporter [Paenibacillus sp. RIFOXYA1_FULL_44_5]
MISFYKKYYKTLFDIALVVITIYLFMLVFSYFYSIAAPIIFSFFVYMIIEPLARRLHHRGMKKSIAATISTLLFILLILVLFVGTGAILTIQINQMIAKIPEYFYILQNNVIIGTEQLQNKFSSMPPDLVNKTKEYIPMITSKASALAVTFLNTMFGMLTSFSSFVANFAIGIVLAYFLSIDIDKWKEHAARKTPKTFKTVFFFLKENVFKGISKYFKAQIKLVSITFLIIFVALILLDVKNSFAISLLCGIFDILPLLGVSTVFIPWIIYLFIVGNTHLAIWLLAVLATVIIVRQILEPKITGESLGVSAFTMLSFMIISLSIFGVAGLILSPILIIMLKALYEQGYLQKWIRAPEEEY